VSYVRVLCLVLASAVVGPGCQQQQSDGEPDEAADTVAMTDTGDEMAAGAEEAGDMLAEAAGTWNMRTVPESGPDTTANEYQLQAAADGGWALLFPNRDPVQAVATSSGDSIIVEAGPFESVRRAGVMVRTRTGFRLEGDRLIGRTVAHYETSGADSVLTLRSEGTRAP
jgi:hypothetical protein